MVELSESNPDKPRFFEIWQGLTRGQRNYVVARAAAKSKKAAADAVGIKADTAYGWGDIVEEAADIIRADMVGSALAMRKEALAKAMLVKIGCLDSDNEALAQKAASELIEWELGRATQTQEITGKGGAPLPIAIVKMNLDEI